MLHKFLKKKTSLSRLVLVSAFINIPNKDPDVHIKNLNFNEYSIDKNHLQVNAEHARIHDTEQVAHLEKLQVQLQQNSGEEYRIRSDFGLIDMTKKNIFFQGPVKITTKDGSIIQTKNLYYSDSRNKIWTSEKVTLKHHSPIKEKITMSGTGLDVETQSNLVSLRDKVLLNYKKVNGASLRAESKRAKFHSKKNQAELTGQLKLETKDFQVEGHSMLLNLSAQGQKNIKNMIIEPEAGRQIKSSSSGLTLLSDSLKFGFDKSKELNRIHALGNVSGKTKDNVSFRSEDLLLTDPRGEGMLELKNKVYFKNDLVEATCEEAFYDPRKKTLLLKKNARLVAKEGEITGSSVFYELNKEQVQIKEAEGVINKEFLGFD